MHRLRGIEGKDGNPLNEARMLCNSMMNNDYGVCADKTIKYVSAKSVLKYEVGGAIRLSERDFILLSKY